MDLFVIFGVKICEFNMFDSICRRIDLEANFKSFNLSICILILKIQNVTRDFSMLKIIVVKE